MSQQPDVVKALELLSAMEKTVESSPGLLGKRFISEEAFFVFAMKLRSVLGDESLNASSGSKLGPP